MKPSTRSALINGAGILLLASTAALVGCGGSSPMVETPPTKPVTPATSNLQGQAYGGQQPVTGMTIQLYTASSGGYGSAATSLATTTTDSNGAFSFSNPACAADPNNKNQLYLVGTGGDPLAAGQGSGKTNSSLALMLALGDCGRLNAGNPNPITHVHINELTTVAAVWALDPFMSGNTQAYQNVGTSSTNTTGLQLAFAAAQQVTSISTGTVPGTLPTGATLVPSPVNTIADVLEFCINSIDPSANTPSSACSSLFSNAPSTTGNHEPTDTITAAMNIAQNPARNVTALDAGVSPTSTFNPVVGTPTAFTIAIQYTGSGLNAPTAIATDQSGNVWVANSGSDVVSLFNNLGAPITSGTTLGGTPKGIAVDLSGNAWVTASDNKVYEVNASGSIATTLSDASLNDPVGVAIDGGGNLWVVNNATSTVSEFSSSGALLSGTGFTGGGISSPVAIAINGNANASCSDCN
jgi:hypothetical protein